MSQGPESNDKRYGNDTDVRTIDSDDEKIINWKEEATAIINDVKTHVNAIEIADELQSNENSIYINITTIENQQYCVHVSNLGFRIVGMAYNTIDDDKRTISEDEDVYETPYALLDKISPSYVESFGNQLYKQLLQLQQMRTQFNEEDEDALDESDEAKRNTLSDDT